MSIRKGKKNENRVGKVKLFAILFVVLLLSTLPLFRKGFFPTHDFIYIARIFEMDRILVDGQFPPRWAPDIRYGEPLYNFYAPLPYIVGALISHLGFGYIASAKVLFGLSLILSGFAMYFFVRELTSEKGAFVAAVAYVYAPYRALDIYVRGAVSESFSFIFVPLIFLFAYRLFKKPNTKDSLFLSLSLAAFLLTHNIYSVLFLPFIVLYLAFLFWRNNFKNFLVYLWPGILGFGLAAFYMLPALSETKYLNTSHLLEGYFNFRGHFVAIPQFFKPFWGFGASLWGPVDDLSLQLGLVHWLAVSLVVFTLTKSLYEKRRIVTDNWLQILFIVAFIFSLFMQHNRSAFIWEAFDDYLAFTQFPWRFMGISVFFSSILFGFVAKKFRTWSVVLTVLVLLGTYIGYFKPESYFTDSIDEHYMADTVLSQDDKTPKDYRTIWTKRTDGKTFTDPFHESGTVTVVSQDIRTREYKYTLEGESGGVVVLPITYFPGWQVYLDGRKIELLDPEERGLIRFAIQEGKHDIVARFTNTPIRLAANTTSLFSLFAVFVIYAKKNKQTS